MPDTSQTFQNRLEDLIVSGELKFYIADDNDAWVDFSDHLATTGKNTLAQLGEITHRTEDKAAQGSFQTSIATILLDNSDHFWDGATPTGLLTTTGAAASFAASKNYESTAWYRSRVKIAYRLNLKDGTTEQGDLGIFLIDGLGTQTDSGTAELRVVGLARALMEESAESVKDGQGWYSNRSIVFLIKELLKVTHGESLPSTFVLPAKIDIATYDGNRTCSSFGRPPEWDGTAWLRKGYTTRATLWANGGNGNRLYLGCDEHIYEYNPATDTYTRMTAAVSELGTGVYVRRLWYNSRHASKPIWGVAWANQSTSSSTVSMVIFSVDADAGTKVVAVTTISSVWTGEFCQRSGAIWTTQRRLGQGVSVNTGENLCVPFAQRIVSVDGLASVYYENLAGIWTDTTEWNDGTLPLLNSESPYLSFARGTGTESLAVRWSMGQQGFCVYQDAGSTVGVIVFATHNLGTDGKTEISIKAYDVGTGAAPATLISNWQDGSGYQHQPTCGVAVDGDDIMIGSVAWVDNLTPTESYTYLTRVDVVTGTRWLYYNSTLDATSIYRTFLELAYNAAGQSDNGTGLHVITLQRDKVGTSTAFQFGTHSAAGAANAIAVKHYSDRPLRGLVPDLNLSTGEWNTFFVEVGSCRLYQYTIHVTGPPETSDDVVLLNDGYPIVDDEMMLASNMTIDGNTQTANIIYGISAPGWTAETQSVAPSGKFYLWKYDIYRSSRVELADFSGLKVWDALELLVQKADYVMGYETDGDFFCVPRPPLDTPDYIFINDATRNRVYDIDKNFGWDEVYNIAEVTPYRVTFKQATAQNTLKARPSGTYTDASGNAMEQPMFAPMYVDTRDTRTQSLLLRCTRSGSMIAGTDTACPKFAWLVYDPVITTRLAISITTNQTTGIVLGSVYGGADNENGIHSLDYMVMKNRNDGSDIIRQILTVDSDTNTVTLQPGGTYGGGFGQAFNADDPAYVIKRNNIDDQNHDPSTWSDEGVAYVTSATMDSPNTYLTVSSVDDLSVGLMVGTEQSEARVTVINPATNTITVNASMSWTIYEPLKAWVAPKTNDTQYAVGNRQVFLKFQIPTTGTVDRDWTATFLEGDKIEITCPGMELAADEQSKQSHFDNPSIAKYGRRPFPVQQNKFLDYRLAKDWAKRLVRTYADPAYVLTVTGLFLPYLSFLTSANTLYRASVVSEQLFPLSQEYGRIFAQIGYIREIRHDAGKGTTTVVLRSARAY